MSVIVPARGIEPPQLIEPYVVLDTHITGTLPAQPAGGDYCRIVCYCDREAAHGGMERLVVARLLVPGAMLLRTLAGMTPAAARRVASGVPPAV